MTEAEYLERALKAYTDGKIDADTYDAMLMNTNVFCEENKEE